MAKRKTIRLNPLDAIVSDPTKAERLESTSAAETRSDAGSNPARSTAQKNRQKAGGVKDSASPLVPPKSPPAGDLLSRVQSLEQENVYIRWLVGGTILLAFLL